jgi:hypothetical protein
MSVEKAVCLPGLAFAAGHGAVDQPRDDGGALEGPLHHRVVGEPCLHRLDQVLAGEKRHRVAHRVQSPDQRGVVGRDETHRVQALRLHPLGQQKAERLLGVPAREAVGDEVFAPVMGEAFDKQAVAFG